MPLWLWDPVAARIVWANQASLDYSGARSLDDLRRLHFRAGDDFACQLAALAEQDLGKDGSDELIRFNGGSRAYRFLCRNAVTDTGGRGVLLGLIGVAADEPAAAMNSREAAAPAKPNGRADNGATAKGGKRSTVPAEKQAEEVRPRPKTVRKASEPLPATAPAAAPGKADEPATPAPVPATTLTSPAQAEIAELAREPQPDFSLDMANALPLIIDPDDGSPRGPMDEVDLLTLQEIARLINGSSSPAPPPRQPKLAAAPRPELRNGTGGAQHAAETALPAANAPSPGFGAPAAAAGTTQRNYFLEALPAAIAIAMGGKLMRANEAFLYAFGYGSEAELRKAGGLPVLFPESQGGVLIAGNSGRRRPPRSARIETLVVSRSGRRRRLPIAFRSVSTGREPVQVIMVLEDAPTREPVEIGIAPADADRHIPTAVQSTASESHLNFLAQVSHEIRTPLNSIIGFAELAKDESLGQDDITVLRGYAEDIHTSAMLALSLVNDLLDITKIAAGKPDLDLAPTNANEVVAEALTLLKPQIEQKRIDLTTQLAEPLPEILADQRSLLQILLNLVTNAVKFTSPGGRIRVATRHDSLVGVTISVTDSGIGMCRDEIAVALEPFRQLEKSLSAQGPRDKGTGLGLPLSKALTEAHGAMFLIDSTPGLGTRIELRFPPDRLAR